MKKVEKHGTGVDKTLTAREKQHGPFNNHAYIEYQFRLIQSKYNDDLDYVQDVGLAMIFHKIARILNNGHNHIDSWHDIAGYATLVERNMREQVES